MGAGRRTLLRTRLHWNERVWNEKLGNENQERKNLNGSLFRAALVLQLGQKFFLLQRDSTP
jgi:hypothetical protein